LDPLNVTLLYILFMFPKLW